MQNISKMLGQTPGAGSPSPQQSAPPQESENPLDKMDEALKNKPKDKKETVAEDMDEETIKQILMSGENSDGLFTPDKPLEEEEELHEEIDEDADLKVGKVKEKTNKYSKRFREDILKNPKKYKVMTPKGEMTVAKAMAEGYNPLTKRFDKSKTAKAIKDKHKKSLNSDDQAALEKIMNPANAQVAPADASKYGISHDSPMIKQGEPQEGVPQALPGQAPVAGEVPQPAATPAAGPDIASLLGGNQ